MPEGKRHLPIVTGGAAPTAEPAEAREWHWAGISALVVTALSILVLPLVLSFALGSGGDDLPGALSRLGAREARTALVRIAVGCAVVSALAAFVTGILAGRVKRTSSRLEPVVGMVFAALVWAIVAGRAWAVFVFAPPMAAFAWLGAWVGRRLRVRAESPRPQPPPD